MNNPTTPALEGRKHTPRTTKALKATQGLFRASAETNGFADFARTLEQEADSLLAQNAEMVGALRELLANGGPLSDPISRKQAGNRARAVLQALGLAKR